jgi:dTDP-4-amino-4,6-dideoxygalactose transaminase
MLDLKRQYDYMKESVDEALRRCLEHQRWILGPEVAAFEEKAGTYLGTPHAVGVSSGTEALVLSLRALAIRTKGKEYFDERDEILTTPFTFTATGDAILRSGATPVFIDADPETFNFDIGKIEEYLQGPSGAHVVGMVPVHIYGRSCDMDRIMSLAGERGLFVVEDVAQAFGGEWRGKKLGTVGTTGAFSFFPSKNLGGFGDGGMVVTADDEVAALVRMLLKHGGRDKYNVDHVGYNARLDALQAAILQARLAFIDEFNGKRRVLAAAYSSGLGDLDPAYLRLPADPPAGEALHVFHQYTIRIAGGRRDDLQAHLKERGVSSMVYYPVSLHHMKVFDGRSVSHGDLKNSEALCREVISLPVDPLQTDEETQRVVSAVRDFFA